MKQTVTKHSHIILLCGCLVVMALAVHFDILPRVFGAHYISKEDTVRNEALPFIPEEVGFVPSYIETPEPLKGIYITSWTASASKYRDPLVTLIDTTELNTIVIDIKDYSGRIVFPVTSAELKTYGSEQVRVRDMQDFIEFLHNKGIYVIGRIAVFQDAYFVKFRPDLAVKNKTGNMTWKDRKGISWIDAGATEYWDYIVLLAKESRDIGFDEINFDYIRFPSDGDMKDISFPMSSTTPKSIVLENFFEYLQTNLSGTGLKISADLFGMVTTAEGDMGIGQILEKALPYFDYISPMVYPSHYPPTFEGWKEPEAHPYEVVHAAMQSGVERAEALASTTSQSIPEYRNKLRPWLQDFGLRRTYGPKEVQAQIKATYDTGLTSWLLWSASNKYTRSALREE